MGRAGPRSFDAVTVGNRETDAWAAYYRDEWGKFLVAAVAMVWIGFGMGPLRTLLGAGHVLRANQLWAPVPDNDPDGARASMRRFYALVAKAGNLDIDPARAARLEIEWWRLHAMNASDQWVAAGRDLNDPLLLEERRSLVASYSALKDAVAKGER